MCFAFILVFSILASSLLVNLGIFSQAPPMCQSLLPQPLAGRYWVPQVEHIHLLICGSIQRQISH